jgi:hypothetical protein
MGHFPKADDFGSHRDSWRQALLKMIELAEWNSDGVISKVNWNRELVAFDEAFAAYLPGIVPVEFWRHHAAWRVALVSTRDRATLQTPDYDDKAYWEHELRAYDRAFASIGVHAADRKLPNFKVMLTLRNACGCVGQGILGTGQLLTWNGDPVNDTVQAIFSRIDVDTLQVVEVVEMDGDDWREFEDSNAEASLVTNVANGHSLETALDGVPASTCAPSRGM